MQRKIALALFIGSTIVACNSPPTDRSDQGKKELVPAAAAAPNTPASTPSAPADADTYYTQKCMACHGSEGKGDGPGAATMDPKPRNYGDAAWQASVTDEDLKKVILGGGMAIGKSPLMPSNPDLKDKPELVDALVKKIRSYKP